MDTIAVVDDRKDMRETVARLISLDLSDIGIDWRVIAVPPLADPSDYAAWIQEQSVCVLVLDENLGEEFEADAVNYNGHTVAATLRAQKPDLPQFIVTSVNESGDLEAAAADLEDVIRRADFNRESRKYVQRMVRAGKSFVQRYEAELSELSRIAEAVVNSSASPKDIAEAQAIRTKLQIPFDVDSTKSLREWVESAESKLQTLESVVERLRSDRRKK